MNPQVSNAQRKYKNNFKMTTTTGYKVSSTNKSHKTTPTTRASDCVDEASDASLYCNQEPLPTPRAAPRPRTNNPTTTSTSLSSLTGSSAAPTPKPRSVLPPSTTSATQQQQQQSHHQYQHHHHQSTLRDSYKLQENMEPTATSSNPTKSSRSKQRLIKVDLSLLQDDDNCFDDTSLASTSSSVSTTIGGGGHNIGVCSQPKMPPYPIGGYMMSDTMAASRGLKCSNNNNNTNVNNIYQQQQPPTTRVTRRTSI